MVVVHRERCKGGEKRVRKLKRFPLVVYFCACFAGSGENEEAKMETKEEEEEEDDDSEEESSPGCTLFIKNLNFATTEETLREASLAFSGLPGCFLQLTVSMHD